MSVPLVCPSCRQALAASAENTLTCGQCRSSFHRAAGYWQLAMVDTATAAGSGAEPMDRGAMQDELTSGRRFAQRYLTPRLERMGCEGARVLSVGCGMGEDVAELRRQGYEAYGVDLWGKRAALWPELDRPQDWYFLADARNLPFQDKSFEVVLCIGLIEHIGAVGGSAELYPDWREQRTAFMAEMLRVSRRGMLLETPNRTFPADLNHIPTNNGLLLWLGRRTGVYFHSPFQRFYVSYGDVERYCHGMAAVRPWDLGDYFGFAIRRERSWIKAMVPLLNLYFRLLDRAPAALRKSCLNPWVSAFIEAS